MDEYNSPVKMPELNLIPESERGIELDKGMKQVMSLLTAYYREERVTLRASQSGVLYVGSPKIKDIVVFKATALIRTWQGRDIACTEVAVIAGLDNADILWVRPYKEASELNAWPLNKTEVFGFTLNNLNELHIKIQAADDIAVIAYTE